MKRLAPFALLLLVSGIVLGADPRLPNDSIKIVSGTGASLFHEAKVTNGAPSGTDYGLVCRTAGTSTISGSVSQGAGAVVGPGWRYVLVDAAGSNVAAVSGAGALKVDNSGVTQPVSAASLPLPTGAATSTIQTDGTQKTQIVNGAGNSLAISGSGAASVSVGSLPLPAGAATEATLALLPLGQNSTTSGQSGPLAQGAVTTAVPAYSSAKTSPLSLQIDGSLRGAVEQLIFVSTNNSTTANLAKTTSFTGTGDSTLGGVGAVNINFFADQAFTIQVQQSQNNTNWDISSSYSVAASTGDGRSFQITASYVRVIITNNGSATTTALRLQTILMPISSPGTTPGFVFKTTDPGVTDSGLVVRNLPSGTQIVNTNGSIVRTQSYDQHTQAFTSGLVLSSTSAAGVQSVVSNWHPSTVGVNNRILQIDVCWAGGISATQTINTIIGTFITADGTGGTTPTLVSFDRGYTVNANSIWRIGATGAPTRISTDLFSMTVQVGTSGCARLYEQNPAAQGESVRLRNGQSEGFEVRVLTGAGAQTTAQGVSATIQYVEN